MSFQEDFNSLIGYEADFANGLLGVFLADAAAVSHHMCDDQQSISNQQLEFSDTKLNPIYNTPNGRLSFYGDLFKSAVFSIADIGTYNQTLLVKATRKNFGAESHYFEYMKKKVNNQQQEGIIQGGYCSETVLDFIKNTKEEKDTYIGSEMTNTNEGVAFALPILLFYEQNNNLFEVQVQKLTQAVKIMGSSQEYLSQIKQLFEIIREFIKTKEFENIQNTVLLDQSDYQKKTDDKKFIENMNNIGTGSQLEIINKCATAIALSAKNFYDGMRLNIQAGGDSCGRAIILGFLLGFKFGFKGGNLDGLLKLLQDKETILKQIIKFVHH